MTEITAKPERTFGLIVGIERYQNSTWNVKGGGPVNDALKFADWLCYKRGVPQKNIRLCLSPVEENQELVRQCQLTVAEPTLPNLDDIIHNFLSQKSGDLLFIFWAGHGLITSERDRKLLCADATYQNWQNIDLSSLLRLLSSDSFEIRHHICIIDACANYLDTSRRPTNLGSKIFNSGQPRQDSKQIVLLAARDGEKAKVSPQKTGYFSQAVREALEQAPTEIFPPNMKVVAEQVEQRLEEEKKQFPTYWFYDSPDYKEEKHFNPFDIQHNIPSSKSITNPPVLILDDDEQWLARHERRLRNAGINCYATQDSREAIEFAREHKINIALIDEILFVPPVSNSQEGELQRWQGRGVIREIVEAGLVDAHFIFITAAPAKRSGWNTPAFLQEIFWQEVISLRRISGVMNVINKSEIESNPEDSYAHLIDVIERVNRNTENSDQLVQKESWLGNIHKLLAQIRINISFGLMNVNIDRSDKRQQ